MLLTVFILTTGWSDLFKCCVLHACLPKQGLSDSQRLLFDYVEDADLWRWQLPHSREFDAGVPPCACTELSVRWFWKHSLKHVINSRCQTEYGCMPKGLQT